MNSSEINIFLDSGAHSIYEVIMKEKFSGSSRKGTVTYDYAETDEFWEYVDRYCEYIKINESKIDVYVNVDVIFNPEMTWKVQKYMEDKGLIPLPVFHFGSDFKWLKKYMDNYEYIGLGGLGQDVSKTMFFSHGDKVFSMLCPGKDNLPKWKTHGFAMTSVDLLFRYPWYSVDSTSWVYFARYGVILLPRKINGKFVFNKSPIPICLSKRSPKLKEENQHFSTLSKMEQSVILKYMKEEGFELGESKFEIIKGKKKEVVITPGLSNDHKLRDAFNMLYFLKLEQAIPEYPWPFKHKKGVTLF